MLPYQSSEGSLLLQEKDLPSLATSGLLMPILSPESPVHVWCVCHDFSGRPVSGSLRLGLRGCVF